MNNFSYFLLLVTAVFANPQGPVLQHGEVNLTGGSSLLEIQVSDKAILNWESFSIGAQETTRFIQPSVDAAVLNRVTGLDTSQINGLLEANGHVYLLNPNGIMIGPNGRVDTAGFTASVLDIQNGEFLNGDQLKIEGASLGQIINLGTIETKGGKITLVAHRIDNQGELLSRDGKVEMFSGHELLLDPRGDSILFICPDLKGEGVENSGKIEALKIELGADVCPTSRAIGLGGMIEAREIEYIGGEIYLTAKSGDIAILPEADVFASHKVIAHAETGTLEHRSKIHSPKGEVRLLGEEVYLLDAASIDVSSDAGGGTVLIGGDYKGSNPEIPNAKYVYSGPDVNVNLNATKIGDGGKAFFWADEGIAFYSKVKAEGGERGGDGGFVEVSSPGIYFFGGLVSTLAPKGKVGTLLLDPTDITISAGATAGGSFSGGPPYTFSGAGPTATLNNTDLENQLALGNVIVDATAGAGGNGDITISAPLTVSQNTLTLLPQRDISIEDNLTISGTGNANGSLGLGIQASNGDITVGPFAMVTLSSASLTQFQIYATNVNVEGVITATAGTLEIGAANNVNIISGALPSSVGLSLNAGADIFINATVNVTAGSVNITAGNDLIFEEFSNLGVSAGSLTINAGRNITVVDNEGIFSNGGTLEMTVGNDFTSAAGDTITGGNGLTIRTQGSMTIGGGLSSPPGSLEMTLTAGGNFNLESSGSISAPTGLVVSAGRDITVGGSVSSLVGRVEMTAGGNFNLSNGSSIAGVGPVNLLAGRNFIGTGIGTIQTTGAIDLNIVADNLHPTPYNFGSGYINLSSYTLQTNGASLDKTNKVYFYTSIPGVNTFPSTINGAANPGGVNEFFGYWYLTLPPPDPPLFEIIYKSGLVSPSVVQTIEIAVTEVVSSPAQITQIMEGTLQPLSIPNPQAKCKTPGVAVQGI